MNNILSIQTEKTLPAHPDTTAVPGGQSLSEQVIGVSNTPVEASAAQCRARLPDSDPASEPSSPGAAVARRKPAMNEARQRERELFERRKAEMAQLAQELEGKWKKRSSGSAPVIAPKPRKSVAGADKVQPVAGPSCGGANAVKDDTAPVPGPRSMFPPSPKQTNLETPPVMEKKTEINQNRVIQPSTDNITHYDYKDHLKLLCENLCSLLREGSDDTLDITHYQAAFKLKTDQDLYDRFGEFTDAIEMLEKENKFNNPQIIMQALQDIRQTSIELRCLFSVIIRQTSIILSFKQ